MHLMLLVGCLSNLTNHTLRFTFRRRGWRVVGTDMYGQIARVDNPTLEFVENTSRLIEVINIPSGCEFGFADFGGALEDFPLLRNRATAHYSFKLGPTLHYFCEGCAGCVSGEITVHSKQENTADYT